MSEETRAKLRSEIQAVGWSALAPHAKRGALLLADTELDLLDVAVAVADDDAAQIRHWLEATRLMRIDPARGTELLAGRRFQFVIVQPYVLAQVVPDKGAIEA